VLDRHSLNIIMLTVLALTLTPYLILDSGSLYFHYAMVYIYLTFLALSWNLHYYLTGLVSLGIQLYFGVSAYLTAYLYNHLGNLLLAAFSGIVVAVILSIGVSRLLIRLRGLSYTIGSWIFAEGALLIMLNIPGLGGSQGYGIPRAIVPVKELYVTSVILVAAFYILVMFFSRSRAGFGVRAMKSSENLAATMGLDISWYKVFTLTICNTAAAVSGALYMLYVKYTDPYTAFSIMWSIESVIISVMGGVNSVVGPFIGSGIFMFIAEYIRFLYAELNILLMGLMMVVFSLLYRDGIMGVINRYRAKRTEFVKSLNKTA